MSARQRTSRVWAQTIGRFEYGRSQVKLTSEQMQSLVRSGERLELDDGGVLIRAGDVADHVYGVIDGLMEVTVPDASGSATVSRLGPGSLVGEIAVIAGGARTASATCSGSCTVVAVPVVDFGVWLDDHPDLAISVLGEARRRVDENRAFELLHDLVGPQDSRLAALLAEKCLIQQMSAGAVFEIDGLAGSMMAVLAGRLVHADGVLERTVGRGNLMGVDTIVEPSDRATTVRATRESTIATISHEDLLDVARVEPGVFLVVARLALREARPTAAQRPLSVAIVPVGDVDADLLAEVFPDEVSRHGATAVVTSASLATSLGRDGIADADENSPGIPRLAEHLHSIELEHRHVLTFADTTATRWTQRAVERSDRIFVVISSRPTPDDLEYVRSIRRTVDNSGGEMLLGIWYPAGVERPHGTASLVDQAGASRVFNGRRRNRDDLRRWARLVTGHGVGIVLSGGGGKGFAHLGVGRALADVGVPIDAIGGASIGGPIGAAIAADFQTEGGPEAVVARQFASLRDYTLPVTAILRGRRIAESIEEAVGGRDLRDFWIPLYVVSTNLTRSRIEIHDRGDASLALRATTSIPGVLPPVPLDGDLLVDGGVLDNLPSDVMAQDSCVGTIICADVSPHSGPGADVDYGRDVAGLRALVDSARGRGRPPSMPSILVRTMLVAAVRDRNEKRDAGLADLYMELDLPDVGLLEFDKVAEVAETGYTMAKPLIDDWLSSPDCPAAFRR